MFCKNCGKLLSSADKFCAECGTRVEVEKPKTAPLEPMFFVEKREEPVQEKKPKRVIHLDEFNWDLDGYPTENRKTEAVDFDWASVLEDKARKNPPKPVELPPEPKKEVAERLRETPKTVEDLLAFLPDNLLELEEEAEKEMLDAVEEDLVEEKVEEESAPEEDVQNELVGDAEIEIKSLDQIIEDFGRGPIEEPTRLIDKSQMKADSVDRFYVFSKKQAEYQNLLDQEYDKIQSGLLEKEAAEAEDSTPTVEEILASGMFDTTEESEEKVVVTETEEVVETEEVEATVEAIVTEETTETEEVAEDIDTVATGDEPIAEPESLELVAIVWALPPAGIIVERTAEPVQEAVEKAVLLADETTPEESAETPVAESAEKMESKAEEKAEESEKEHLTFADIFNDEDEEEAVRKGGGCLKLIATILIILVIIELGILGVQYFAPNSEAAKFVNQTYGKVIGLITGNEEPGEAPQAEENSEPASAIGTLILAQQEKNENIAEIVENTTLVFATDTDYGYAELPNTYEFRNSPWYETAEGKSITYGDELIGTLIQYYSALPDMVNDVNKDVLDYVADTSALYDELSEMEGDENRGYTISKLEIGEIRTGQNGFYVMVNVTSADKMQPEQTQQTQLVYLEAIPSKNVIKIKETKNI